VNAFGMNASLASPQTKARPAQAPEPLRATSSELREALLRSEERHRIAGEAAKVGVWDWSADPKQCHVDASLKRLLGFEDHELAAELVAWRALVHPEDIEYVAGVVRAHLVGMTPSFEIEHRMLHKDGTVRWFLTRGTAIRDAAGRVARLVGSGMDVSERRRLEQQLHHAQKLEAVGQLAGGIAHDFNNLLGVIGGYAEMAARAVRHDEAASRPLEQVLRAAQRAAELTRQLLAFSRRQELQPRVLDLNEVVAEIEPMLRRLIGEDVGLELALDRAPACVRADRGQLEQVVANLAVNARDAMRHGGKLTLRTSRARLDEDSEPRMAGARVGRHAVLAVADTGHGMDAATLARIFEPFFTTKESGKGTGLGLATVHDIVAQNGGHIRVSSEPGRGTTFEIWLPEVEEQADRPLDDVASAARGGCERLLVVEDEASMRMLTAELLRDAGYEVEVAEGGEQALALIASGVPAPRLLLIDVVLPGMSGPELAARVRALLPGIGVAYVSGYSHEAIAQRSVLEEGALLIAKPFSNDTLLRGVRQVLDASCA
jgi:two-component system, cell cycle sensor histidine kinase and response regulator CckA